MRSATNANLQPEGHSAPQSGSGDCGECIVLSYAPEDKPHAAKLRAGLFERGFTVLRQTSDDPAWFAEMDGCTVCIPLLSGHYVCSYACEGQFTYAKDLGKHMVQVVVDSGTFHATLQF